MLLETFIFFGIGTFFLIVGGLISFSVDADDFLIIAGRVVVAIGLLLCLYSTVKLIVKVEQGTPLVRSSPP
jgi:hypothetical protein